MKWPVLVTLIMFLVAVYVRFAMAEERDAEAQFGDVWRRYAQRTPRFMPHRGTNETGATR